MRMDDALAKWAHYRLAIENGLKINGNNPLYAYLPYKTKQTHTASTSSHINVGFVYCIKIIVNSMAK